MSRADKISASLGSFCSGLASWLKVLLLSGRPSSPGNHTAEEIVVLGNGPSLNDTLKNELDFVMKRSRLAVNFAANAPQFQELTPQFYVLADPHFFTKGKDENVDRLWNNLRAVSWPMTLYVPVRFKHLCEALLGENTNITLKIFNLTPGEGCKSLVYPLYRFGLAMPRPRNVLIPSLMIAIREGFRTIYVAGADHTWTKTLDVDDQNRVISVQPHFYKDGKEEQARVNTEYAGYHLHDILHSMTVAFRSYHEIKDYADRGGVRIFNITRGSMIDAFPRFSP